MLIGSRQEVGRGELWAFVLALRSTRNNLTYICDRKSVYDGWHGRAWKTTHLADTDLWRQVAAAADLTRRVVLVVWMESHQADEPGSELTKEQRFFIYGNDQADS